MKKVTYPDLILAITLSARGFSYVFFEAPLTPYDWAVASIRGAKKNEQMTKRIMTLFETYHPTTLILEHIQNKTARRSQRLRKLSLQLAHMAQCQGIEVTVYDRAAIREAFAPAGARSKVEIAQTIALAIPEFGHRLPPERKIWMSEDSRQMLFDAAALGMTHHQLSVLPNVND